MRSRSHLHFTPTMRRTSVLGHVVRLHDAQPLRLNRIPWASTRRILILLDNVR
jgi:hypothetical protein